jgi:hypothetical protein
MKLQKSILAALVGAAFGGPLYMAQHDQAIANADGATVRADINNALVALFSNSSGATEPSTRVAYQLWADTTSGLLKQRNAANSAWIVRGTLTESFIVARSSNTIIAAADFGKVFNCTSSFTQTLTAAATLGDGFVCHFRNNGTGTITIDPNSSETIDGATTIALKAGESATLFCTGTAWITVGRVRSQLGQTVFWMGHTLPDNALVCDGTAYSRTTYAALAAELVKSATITMTIASPCVVTWTAHGFVNYMPVKFTTTGALPTGLTAGRTYYVQSVTTDTFRLAATPGGADINTSGSQSGTHTGICAPAGDGDGSTTFNVPNLVDRVPLGMGAATTAESFLAAAVTTGTDTITVLDNTARWVTGMAVVLTTSGVAPTGLTAGNTYYVIRTGAATIKLASSMQNASLGTAIDITAQGSGTHTLTHTRPVRGLGEDGGEDTHLQAGNEVGAHTHDITAQTQNAAAQAGGDRYAGVTQSTAGGAQANTVSVAMNNMPPFLGGRWIIYYA